jgi:predicted nucleic acid-binding protein
MTVKEIPPEAVVLDASFVLRFVLHTQAPRPHAAGLSLLKNVDMLVPSLWNAEIANALVQAERRGLAAPAKIGAALAVINGLAPSVDTHPVDVTRNLEVARVYGLSAYDALYFELALRRKAALATYDEGMIAAAANAGIRLFPAPAN